MTLRTTTIFLVLAVLVALSPAWAAEFSYKEYTKAPKPWRRGFVFGISQYMSTVAQPDEEVPYPMRTAFQRCLGSSPDTILTRHVEAYAATHSSSGSMVAVVMRALFDLCRSEIAKTRPANTVPGRELPPTPATRPSRCTCRSSGDHLAQRYLGLTPEPPRPC